MRSGAWRLAILAAPVCVVLLLGFLIMTAPKHPVAMLRVLDAGGQPVAGAIIRPEGLRTKPGPYVSGWYGWRTGLNSVPNNPVRTDQNGYASVPYPKYVFERIETGTLCLSVNHPDFVPERPERIVATAPPAGAPWRVRLEDLWNRMLHKALMARPDPILLQKGAVLKVSRRTETAASGDARLFVQVSGLESEDTNFWIRPEPGVVMTRRLSAGPHSVRALQVDSSGATWFSDVMTISAVAGRTNKLAAEFRRGVTVRGRLDETAPRPIRDGRVIAHVWPPGLQPKDSPPQWHAWTRVREDGTFEMDSLPSGDLEIVALCDGFVSTNGPGQFSSMHYPQKHSLGTNDITITMGLEPTATLEVEVMDDEGHPLKDAEVSTWPNVRYGEWSAVILGGDCYNTADRFRDGPAWRLTPWWERSSSFHGTSDVSGLAVVRNLPVEVTQFSVEHPRFTLPAVVTNGGDKRRQAAVTLIRGQTNRTSVRLEVRDRSPIAHY